MQHAEYFKEFLRDEVNLSQSRLDKLAERVEAVFRALGDDSTIGVHIKGKIPQGSWPHRLIIKPKPDGDFDADFLLEFDEIDEWPPKKYVNEVYNALHRHSVYAKQGHGRKCRSVYLRVCARRRSRLSPGHRPVHHAQRRAPRDREPG